MLMLPFAAFNNPRLNLSIISIFPWVLFCLFVTQTLFALASHGIGSQLLTW